MTIIYDNHSLPRLVKFECNACHKQFERGYGKGIINRLSPRDLKQDRHYCELACSYLDKQPRKSKIIKCDTCGLEMRKAYSQIKKTNFCSRACYGTYKSTDPEVAERSRRPCSEETKRKIGKANKGKQARLGAILSQETKDKISNHHKNSECFAGDKNPMFGKKHSAETKEKMSIIVSNEIASGERKAYGSNYHEHGTIETNKSLNPIYYRSSWEKAAIEWFENNQNIKAYSYEPCIIEYFNIESTGFRQKRRYSPDFIVEFTNGDKEMWEIKPTIFHLAAKVIAKQEAAERYCQDNGILCYKLLGKEDLVEIGILSTN